MGASLVAQMVKNLPAMLKTQVQSLGWEDPMEKEMATHSSTLTWKIPWTEEPGRLLSVESQRVRHTEWLYLLTKDILWVYRLWIQSGHCILVCLFFGLNSTLPSFLVPLSRFYPLFFRKQKPRICFCMMTTTKTKMNMSLVHGEDEIWCDLYNF